MADTAKYLIEQDLLRYGRKRKFGFATFFRFMFVEFVPGIRFSIIFRLCQYYRKKNRLLFYFYFLWLRRIRVKYGIDVSYRTKIGKGLYIGHFGGICIHGDSVLGENCTLSQGISIGVLNRGPKAGCPILADRVYVGPGAMIFGRIHVGNDVLVGVNAVVSFDVPDGSIVAAPAAQIVSTRGSEGYIGNPVS
jgi:serine O-acetyltransferase